jgi:chemotaxis protein methyltransferase CheR
MEPASITDLEFAQFQQFLFEAAGISLSPAKKALVSGRLAKRLRHHGLPSYGHYYQMLRSGRANDELQTAIDLLTTNETYFFREPKHFDFMRARVSELGRNPGIVRVWSAASSSGEEAYSIAMVLAQAQGAKPWEVVGTDISSRMVVQARKGHYPMERARHIPPDLLRQYCLKGIGKQAGTLLVARELREHVRFLEANLNAPLPDLGVFDFVFLRNVMIYFEMETKRQVVRRLLPLIKPGGYLFVGHSETLNDITDAVKPIKPAIYRKP